MIVVRVLLQMFGDTYGALSDELTVTVEYPPGRLARLRDQSRHPSQSGRPAAASAEGARAQAVCLVLAPRKQEGAWAAGKENPT